MGPLWAGGRRAHIHLYRPAYSPVEEARDMRKIRIWLVLLVWTAALAACGGSADPAAEACDELNELGTAIAATAVVTPASGIEQIIAAQTRLITTWSDFARAAGDVANPEVVADIEAANAQMEAIPVATQTTGPAAARASLSTQVQIAQDIVHQYTPACQTLTSGQ